MKSRTLLFLLIAGQISSILVFRFWYYTIRHYPPYEKYITDAPNTEVVVVIGGITILYIFLYFLVLSIRSLQTPWKSFFLISIITLFTFFIIPSGYFARYEIIKAQEKIDAKRKRVEEMKVKSNNTIALSDAANSSIKEPQERLESDRKEYDRLRKQLNEIIRKTKFIEEGNKTKRNVVIQTKLNKDFSKINSEAGNADFDTKNQEIIFKVQIISSSTRVAKKSLQFNGLTNVWEYKDGGLYKYAVGNQMDLRSASELQSEFRKKGFSGAFVVAFKNGKRIPVREARKLLN